MKLHFLSRQTGCTRSFFTPQPPGCGKGGKSTAFMRVSSPKTTTENCMDYPVWNELFTFSTGFSTVFVKKRRSFQRCFPPFPHSFPHPVEESPIQAVMDAAAFWKFVGKNVGNLPFIKKKVEDFSFVFTVYSGLRVCFSPIWNFAPGSFPQTVGEKNPVWKTDTNCGFPHWKSFLPRRRGGGNYPFRHRLRRCHTPPFLAARHLPPAGGSRPSRERLLVVAIKFPASRKGVPLGELARSA